MSDIIIMSNNMESLKLLLDKDTSSIKPKLIKKSGQFTKKFLKWNLQQLKSGKTTLYADNTKYYDPVKRNIKKIPLDKRYKKFKIKPSFLSKNVKVGSSYAPQSFFNSIKNQSQEFSYELQKDKEISNFLDDEEIRSNILLKTLINQNNISGNYRIIIKGSVDGVLIDDNYNIDNNFWKDHKMDFLKDSEFAIWNNDILEQQTITFIFSKETKLNYKFFDQAFLNGVSHCFFTPILNHFENIIEGTKAKATKKKYQGLVNKIQGKQLKNEFKEGYIHKYAKGIKRNDICHVCEDLQIEVVIEQPLNNTEKLFEYRSNKKPLKKFKFLNTRSDHVEYATNNDLFKQYEPISISQKEMIETKKQLDKDKIYNTYTKNSYGISTLKTLDNYYVLDNEFYNCVKEFEKDTVLEKCDIDALKYPELQSFIDAGTHFNGTIDFVDTSQYREQITKDIKHIDMTKAYTCFEQCKYYNGFMGHITDFREVDNFEEKGLYRIVDIDFSNCSEQFKDLNVMLSWFHNNNIYTDAELRALKEQKATFKITHGAFGTGFDMKLSNDMINKKVLVKHLDSGEDIKIPYYCKYFGMITMTGKTKKFYMDGDKKYFESMNFKNASIYYENNTAKIVFDKSTCFNKKHITAQITAYQRLIMLEQLLEMNFDNLVRVCVDGIYYKEHDIKLHKSFSEKTKMTFKNSPCEEYLSGILLSDFNTDNNYSLPDAKPRKFYKTELFDGEGGLGKTYHNIFIDKGLINLCYIPHSWKLSTAQTKQLEREQGETLKTSVHHYIFNKESVGFDILKNYSVILIDECSMLTEKQKQYIIENTAGRVIFMGDIDMQLAPCDGDQMNKSGIDNIERLTKNWRFQDDKMIELNNILRKNGDEKYINYFKLGIKTITKDELKKQYKPEDIILNYYKDNKYGEMFKDIEKYKVVRNTRDYKNGEIVFDKNIQYTEFRHGYTIHSVQGETFDKNIYIDIKSRKGKTLLQNRLFYTAISRAKYFGQLHLIIDNQVPSIKDLESTFINDLECSATLEFIGINEKTAKILKKKIDYKKQFEKDLKKIGFTL